MLGRQRGVLAALMNNVNSGKFNMTVALALHSIVHSEQIVAILLILGSLALSALVWIFLRNMYQAILRRSMLELRTYDKLPMSHLLFFKSVGRWGRGALTLLLAAILQELWNLTIIGGFIKRYSYFMVPFIVAENPDIRPRDAVTLSRRMMDGHKWECCKLELSFLGWMALGFVTFGVADVLWSIPYRMAAVYLLLPILDAAVIRVRPRVFIPVCVVLLVCFMGDIVYSRIHPNAGAGITDYKQTETIEAADTP